MAQLVEALRYKPEDCWFDSRLSYWNFSLSLSFRPHYGPGIGSASNKSEYQAYFVGLKDNLDRLCGLVVRVSGYRYRGLGFHFRRYQIF